MDGDFEVHLTVRALEVDAVALSGLKVTQIELDRGATPVQPMFSGRCRGTLEQARMQARRWCTDLRLAGHDVVRVKIEAALWNSGIPASDLDARGEPPGRYFEHHLKLLLDTDDPAEIAKLVALVEPYRAHVSRNARRARPDGRRERFVTQRCFQVGQGIARMYLSELRATIDAAGYEVLDVEEEYVVEDDNPSLDAGWIRGAGAQPEAWSDWDWIVANERRARSMPAGSPGYPSTYQPVTRQPGVEQLAAFDPALLQYRRAYRAGDPTFADERLGLAWRQARRAAIEHVLAAVAGSPWAAHLVLRGSVLLRAWLGGAAREPGDIDFVVNPHDIALDSAPAWDLFDGVISAVTGGPTSAVAFDLERVAVEDIWTYERAPGRRLVFTWQADGLPPGIVQVDLVFNEPLPEPPITVAVPRSRGGSPIVLAAASPRLSLAWKLLWLDTDLHPQGKDLYDAVLLAEHTTLPRALLRPMLQRELGASATDLTPAHIRQWTVDWANLRDEHPWITGELDQWRERLITALAPTFREEPNPT